MKLHILLCLDCFFCIVDYTVVLLILCLMNTIHCVLNDFLLLLFEYDVHQVSEASSSKFRFDVGSLRDK